MILREIKAGDLFWHINEKKMFIAVDVVLERMVGDCVTMDIPWIRKFPTLYIAQPNVSKLEKLIYNIPQVPDESPDK